MFKNALQVLLITGIGAAFGYAAGYSKAREKFIEALAKGLINSAEKEEVQKEESHE